MGLSTLIQVISVRSLKEFIDELPNFYLSLFDFFNKFLRKKRYTKFFQCIVYSIPSALLLIIVQNQPVDIKIYSAFLGMFPLFLHSTISALGSSFLTSKVFNVLPKYEFIVWFEILFRLLYSPFAFIFLFLFYRLQNYNFLLGANIFESAVSIYAGIIPFLFLFRKWYQRLFAIIFNYLIFLILGVTMELFSLDVQKVNTNTAIEGRVDEGEIELVYNHLDEISKELIDFDDSLRTDIDNFPVSKALEISDRDTIWHGLVYRKCLDSNKITTCGDKSEYDTLINDLNYIEQKGNTLKSKLNKEYYKKVYDYFVEVYRVTDPLPSDMYQHLKDTIASNGKLVSICVSPIKAEKMIYLRNEVLINKRNRINAIKWANDPLASFLYWLIGDDNSVNYDFYPFNHF